MRQYVHVWMCVCVSICLSVCLCTFVWSVCLSLSVCLCACLCVFPLVCVSVWVYVYTAHIASQVVPVSVSWRQPWEVKRPHLSCDSYEKDFQTWLSPTLSLRLFFRVSYLWRRGGPSIMVGNLMSSTRFWMCTVDRINSNLFLEFWNVESKSLWHFDR